MTARPVVVDTMIASAWLGRTHSQRKARWVPLLERATWVLPFTVVAELRFGAEVAGWGARRRGVLERLIASAGVSHRSTPSPTHTSISGPCAYATATDSE